MRDSTWAAAEPGLRSIGLSFAPSRATSGGAGRRFHAPAEVHERLGYARQEARVALFEHLAVAVEGRVGERRRVAEEEGARGERLQRRREQVTRARDEIG